MWGLRPGKKASSCSPVLDLHHAVTLGFTLLKGVSYVSVGLSCRVATTHSINRREASCCAGMAFCMAEGCKERVRQRRGCMPGSKQDRKPQRHRSLASQHTANPHFEGSTLPVREQQL